MRGFGTLCLVALAAVAVAQNSTTTNSNGALIVSTDNPALGSTNPAVNTDPYPCKTHLFHMSTAFIASSTAPMVTYFQPWTSDQIATLANLPVCTRAQMGAPAIPSGSGQ